MFVGWEVWNDKETGDKHVLLRLDVPAMDDVPNPWHVLGDYCPCQPRILAVDWATGRRRIGHQDPIQ